MSKQSDAMPPKGEGTSMGMIEPGLDIKSIERKTYASYHEDGLVEIVAGVIAVGLSLMIATNGKPWIIQLALIPLIFLFAAARQRITYPRIGFIEASAKRVARANAMGWGVTVVLFVLSVLLLYAIFARDQGGQPHAIGNAAISLMMLAIGLPGALAMACIGWLTRVARWFAYSALTLACLAAAWLLHADLLWGLGAAGVLIVLSGSVVLWRFIRGHPVLADEKADDASGGGAR